MSIDSYKLHLIYEYFEWNEIKLSDRITNIERRIRSGLFVSDDVYSLIKAQVERELFTTIKKEIYNIMYSGHLF